MKKILIVCFCLTIAASSFFAPAPVIAEEETNYGDYNTYTLLEDFVEQYPVRVAGSAEEKTAANGIYDIFLSYGLETKLQRFEFTDENNLVKTSQNVVGVMRSSSNTEKQVVIGAHYDNVGLGEGAFDNASGIAVLLDLISKLSLVELQYNVVFVAFGAEEVGLYGSACYVSQLTDTASIMCMINVDSVAAGDNLYIYCEDVSTSYCDFFIDCSLNNDFGVTLQTKSPTKDVFLFVGYGGYPYYQTAQASDHSSFREAGIPTVFFYAGNYVVGELSYVESESQDSIMHTASDTIDVLKEKYGLNFVKKMETVSDTVFKALTNSGFSVNISSARDEMVDDIWLSTWLPCLIAAVIQIGFGIWGFWYKRKLDKISILEEVEVKNDNFFNSSSGDDIFKL